MLTVIFEYFIDNAFVFGVETLQEGLAFLLSLHEGFGLVQQVNILHIELIQLVQIVVKDYMQILLDFLTRKVINVVVAINEACHVREKVLLLRLKLGQVFIILQFLELVLQILRRLMRQCSLRPRWIQGF